MSKAKKKDFSLTIPEEDRSARGRGWEARRSGRPVESNPFEAGSWQHEEWEIGWNRFKKPSEL